MGYGIRLKISDWIQRGWLILHHIMLYKKNNKLIVVWKIETYGYDKFI